MPQGEHDWLDSDAGPVVRPYAVTGGRAKPVAGAFDLVAFVVNASDGVGPRHLQPEHYAILARTKEPVTVAELASHLDLALGVVRVLLGDLLQQGLIEMHEPVYDQSVGPQRPDDRILKAVVNGLRSL
jgi:hypothetical protein